MIRHLVALDMRRGIAKDNAMPPWRLTKDEAYFTEQTLKYGGIVLMGKRTLLEALKNRPLKGRVNYVVTHSTTPIPGIQVINNLPVFISSWPKNEDLWIIGGAEIFAQTIDMADELYITEIDGDFDCDRFYPDYKQNFKLKQASEPITEHGVSYRFCIYTK